MFGMKTLITSHRQWHTFCSNIYSKYPLCHCSCANGEYHLQESAFKGKGQKMTIQLWGTRTAHSFLRSKEWSISNCFKRLFPLDDIRNQGYLASIFFFLLPTRNWWMKDLKMASFFSLPALRKVHLNLPSFHWGLETISSSDLWREFIGNCH